MAEVPTVERSARRQPDRVTATTGANTTSSVNAARIRVIVFVVELVFVFGDLSPGGDIVGFAGSRSDLFRAAVGRVRLMGTSTWDIVAFWLPGGES